MKRSRSIAGQTGADIFKIVPTEPYVDDYEELLDIAAEEKQNRAWEYPSSNYEIY